VNRTLYILFFLIAGFLSESLRAVERLEMNEPLSVTWKWQVLKELGSEQDIVKAICGEIDAKYVALKWKPSRCAEIPFRVFGWSELNRPLIYFQATDRNRPLNEVKTTLIQCAIHGDELTALPMCMGIIHDIIEDERGVPQDMGVVVQPLLNPDGYLTKKSQRPNARGVDLNRNFKTPEWPYEAQTYWAKRDKMDPRKFPGTYPESEAETKAITQAIADIAPQKIISIHTPLGFLELDASGDKDHTRRAKFLAINMVKNSKNLNFKSYGIWPGSLGNYAGILKKIPVYTMELPPGSSDKARQRNWSSYSFSLWRAVRFDLSSGVFQED